MGVLYVKNTKTSTPFNSNTFTYTPQSADCSFFGTLTLTAGQVARIFCDHFIIRTELLDYARQGYISLYHPFVDSYGWHYPNYTLFTIDNLEGIHYIQDPVFPLTAGASVGSWNQSHVFLDPLGLDVYLKIPSATDIIANTYFGSTVGTEFITAVVNYSAISASDLYALLCASNTPTGRGRFILQENTGVTLSGNMYIAPGCVGGFVTKITSPSTVTVKRNDGVLVPDYGKIHNPTSILSMGAYGFY
jgi:hypothetical protein